MKYPSTPYFAFSPANHDPKRPMVNPKTFLNRSLIITVKMDGSNVRLTNTHIGARNGEDAIHPSFDYLKQLHQGFKFCIPDTYSFYGEWCYAKHSISYIGNLALDNYLMLFGIRAEEATLWISWDRTKDFAEKIMIPTVPILAENISFSTEKSLQTTLEAYFETTVSQGHEGIVVRWADSFLDTEFNKAVGKMVRINHVQTTQHWKTQPIIKNQLVK